MAEPRFVGKIISPQPGPQTWFLACPYTERMFGGARGGGKTYGIMLDWQAHALRYGSAARGIIFRRTLKEFDDFVEKTKNVLPALGWNLKVGKNTWEHPSGASLKMRYLDQDADADGYQGHEYSYLAFDEIGNWPKPDPINKLRACLRSAEGVPVRFVATANPGGAGHAWCKERYIDPAPPLTEHKDPITGHSIIFIPSGLKDNKLLVQNDPDYANRLKGTGPSWLVQAWLEGNWNISVAGNVFKREWWQTYDLTILDNPEKAPKFIQIIQSWDTAFKAKKENDRSACVTIGVTRSSYYLLNVWKGKLEFPELKKMVIKLADVEAGWSPDVIFMEDKASGQSLIQELRKDTRLPIKPIQVDTDKIARAHAITPTIEAGKVFVPETAPWKDDFMEELSGFPLAGYDDQVDAFTQAMDRLTHRDHALRIEIKKNTRAIRSLSIFQR